MNSLSKMSEIEDKEGSNENSCESSLIAGLYSKLKNSLSTFKNNSVGLSDAAKYMASSLSAEEIFVGNAGAKKISKKPNEVEKLQKRRNIEEQEKDKGVTIQKGKKNCWGYNECRFQRFPNFS